MHSNWCSKKYIYMQVSERCRLYVLQFAFLVLKQFLHVHCYFPYTCMCICFKLKIQFCVTMLLSDIHLLFANFLLNMHVNQYTWYIYEKNWINNIQVWAKLTHPKLPWRKPAFKYWYNLKLIVYHNGKSILATTTLNEIYVCLQLKIFHQISKPYLN